MSWILLIIQLIPTIIDIIQKIRELIGKLPRSQRGAARSDLVALARAHVHKRRGGNYALAKDEAVAFADFELLRASLAARVAAAAKKP